jgi:hypothetical protein
MPASTYPKLLALLLSLWALPLSGAHKNDEGPVSPPAGEKLVIHDYLVPGKTVIFGFKSAFSPPCPCAPCTELGDPLAALALERGDLVVVAVEVNREGMTKVDWNSPVALQFGLRRLPHFMVYGPDGQLVVQDDQRSGAAPGRDMVHDMIMQLPEHRAAAAALSSLTEAVETAGVRVAAHGTDSRR